jgi:excisionase family DNA binding protein
MELDFRENPRPETPWLTAGEAADYLRVKLATIRAWTSRGLLPYAKRGHVVRYSVRDLDRWFRAGARTSEPAGREA